MKVILVTLSCLVTGLLSSNAFAKVNKSVIDELSNCAHLKNDMQRLACFDTLVKAAVTVRKTTKKTESAPELVVLGIPPQAKKVQQIVNTKQIEDFSKEHIKIPTKDRGPDTITATVSKTKKLLRGQWVIYLENGQKWEQKDSNKIKIKVGDSIRLTKASLGSVYLNIENSQRRIKVKRLK